MDPYNPNRDVTDQFLEKVADWIRQSGEVLVVLRYLLIGGSVGRNRSLAYGNPHGFGLAER
jgi:hypothetical protein